MKKITLLQMKLLIFVPRASKICINTWNQNEEKWQQTMWLLHNWQLKNIIRWAVVYSFVFLCLCIWHRFLDISLSLIILGTQPFPEWRLNKYWFIKFKNSFTLQMNVSLCFSFTLCLVGNCVWHIWVILKIRFIVHP
jgi:hypothetical protein